MRITADFIPTNFWPQRWGYKPVAIVNHITAGAASSCRYWFKNPNSYASSHYLVCKDGTIYQFVKLEHSAWANGCQGSNPSAPMYSGRATAKIVKEMGLMLNANIYTVSIEHENDWGGKLTAKQLEASAWLHAHIVKEVKRIFGHMIPLDRDHVLGHCEIDPVGKAACPGAEFPYEEIIRRAKLYLKGETPKPEKPKPPTKTPRKVYRIQVAAYSNRAMAEQALKIVKRRYPSAFITEG